MYITSISQAKEEIRKRKESAGMVRSVLNEHIKSRFGISDFTKIVSSYVSSSTIGTPMVVNDTNTYGVLARQIPGACVEDIACYLLSRRIGLIPCALAFTRDTFYSGSNDKLFRINIPFIEWSKKGNLVERRTPIIKTPTNSYNHFDMVRMDRLVVDDKPLATYHQEMQASVCKYFDQPYIWGDVSAFWGEILALAKESGRAPESIWRSTPENKDVLSLDGYTPDEARNLIVRPSAKWYYHLYLSMFLDGSFVLLETYDNETGGVPEARRLFEKEMSEIYRATGFMPLVVKTSPLRNDMLFVNRHLVDEPQKTAHSLIHKKYWLDDTTSTTRWLADQVVQVGNNI